MNPRAVSIQKQTNNNIRKEGSVSCYSDSEFQNNICGVTVSPSIVGEVKHIRGSSDHSYAKILASTTGQEENRSTDPGDHTYFKTIENIHELKSSISDEIVEFNSKNVQYKDVKEKYDKILKNLVELSDQSHKNIEKNPELLWHCRLGHVSKTYLKKASRFLPELKELNFDRLGDCSTCI